jgi:hypothetical protein
VAGRISPGGSAGFVVSRLRAAAERNRERGWLEAPAEAHARPPALEKPVLTRINLRGVGGAVHVAFESEFEPLDAEVRDSYLAVTPNRQAHALLFRDEIPRPTLICIHGYGFGRFAVDARCFEVRELRRRLPIDVVLYTLPLHGRRARGRRSGAGFLDGDPLWTNAAMAQAAWELRRLAGWLRSEGAPLVGVQGMSLGGYTTALIASLDERLACAVPRIPASSLAELCWDGLKPSRRQELEAAGAGKALLDEAWATHALLRHRPRVPAGGRMLVAGSADRICPPAAVRALWEHWERPRLVWFPGSHMLPLGYRKSQRAVEDHVRSTLCPPQSAEAVPLSRFQLRP